MSDDTARDRPGRRKRRLRAADPFAESSTDDQPLSVRAADAALFGEIRAREGARPTLRLLDIHDIQPDPQQPRRSLPRHLRQGWDGRAATLPDLLRQWGEAAAQRSGGAPLSLPALLALSEAEWADASDSQSRPPDAALAELLALAASIRHDGLQHPITVARAGTPRPQEARAADPRIGTSRPQDARNEAGGFLLESGERRWLAFHLLSLFDREGERWARIPAHIQPERDVWRQASENSARDDLNAIARARQYALLLMDLCRERAPGEHPFRPIGAFLHEQDFYAQAHALRIPYGASARLLNAMGRQHRNAFLRCRQLLALPRPLWERGDEENWSEDQLLQAAKSATPQTAAKTARIKDTPSPWERQFARWQRQLNPGKLRRLPAPQRRQLREWLRGLIQALGED